MKECDQATTSFTSCSTRLKFKWLPQQAVHKLSDSFSFKVCLVFCKDIKYEVTKSLRVLLWIDS